MAYNKRVLDSDLRCCGVSTEKDRHLGVVMSEEFVGLVQALYSCVCGSAQVRQCSVESYSIYLFHIESVTAY